MTTRKIFPKICLSVASVLFTLLVLEIALRVFYSFSPDKVPRSTKSGNQTPPPLHIATNSPMLYELNPNHPDINTQGLRDDEAAAPKPEGTLRILVLGDSVAFGIGVPREKAFPNLLESLLQKHFGNVEVINSGVSGYTTYNELQYYLTKGRDLAPDVVLLAFCLNDVVNPRLHWGGYTENKKLDIPDAAIPNPEYDRDCVQPRIAALQKPEGKENAAQKDESFLQRFALYKTVKKRIAGLIGPKDPNVIEVLKTPKCEAGWKKQPSKVAMNVPTYLTAEDDKSIEVLMDRASPEWQWLDSTLDELHAAVLEDHATFMIAAFPLAYQLDEGYPFIPQNQLADYCLENEILYIDFLPVLKQHPKEDIFFLNNSIYYDIWHITALGHEICAEEVMKAMLDRILF